MDVDIDRGDRSALGCSHFGGPSTEEGTQRRAAAGCELALCSTCSTRSVEPRSGRRGSPNDRGSSVVDSVADSALQQLSFQQAGCGGRPDSTPDGWRGRFSSGRRRRGYGRAKNREMDLKALESAVQQLQALALNDSDRPRKHSRSKDKKHKKSKKKSKKERKHKKKSRKSRGSSSSSPSSSNSSRSRSRSSSSSSSTKKPLRWKEGGKSKSVSYSDLAHVDQLKFKKKGDLVAFAAKHPGALTAHFLAGVFTRLSKGTLAKSSQLRDVSVTSWAHQFAGLSELRDMKEVLTLAEILDHVNRREIARALDVLVQRILAIQAAKMKGGSWEKAEGIELVNTNKTLASSSMLALTNG